MTSSTEKNQPKQEETFKDKTELAFALEKLFSILADESAIVVEDFSIEKILNY